MNPDRFQIERVIGLGGMGEVERVMDRFLGVGFMNYSSSKPKNPHMTSAAEKS